MLKDMQFEQFPLLSPPLIPLASSIIKYRCLLSNVIEPDLKGHQRCRAIKKLKASIYGATNVLVVFAGFEPGVRRLVSLDFLSYSVSEASSKLFSAWAPWSSLPSGTRRRRRSRDVFILGNRCLFSAPPASIIRW